MTPFQTSRFQNDKGGEEPRPTTKNVSDGRIGDLSNLEHHFVGLC